MNTSPRLRGLPVSFPFITYITRNSNKLIHCVRMMMLWITKRKIIYILRFYIRLYHYSTQMSTDLSLIKQALPIQERLLFVYSSFSISNRSAKPLPNGKKLRASKFTPANDKDRGSVFIHITLKNPFIELASSSR